jgi:hypothetical protein
MEASVLFWSAIVLLAGFALMQFLKIRRLKGFLELEEKSSRDIWAIVTAQDARIEEAERFFEETCTIHSGTLLLNSYGFERYVEAEMDRARTLQAPHPSFCVIDVCFWGFPEDRHLEIIKTTATVLQCELPCFYGIAYFDMGEFCICVPSGFPPFDGEKCDDIKRKIQTAIGDGPAPSIFSASSLDEAREELYREYLD